MAKELPAVWEALKDVKSDKGYTLSNSIQTGVETPHLGVGVTAGDENCWEVFKDLLYPVIKGWHGGYDAATQTHKMDLDPSKLVFDDAAAAVFDKYVVSTRIRAARNISGYGLPAGATDADRENVKDLLVKAFTAFEGDLKGTYYPLEGMTDAVGDDLRGQGFLFQVPKRTNLLTMAGAARNWPKSRGIFHNDNKTALCWVNEEDHCRIISMALKGNIKDVFARFCAISEELKKVCETQGTKLMWSDNLGYVCVRETRETRRRERERESIRLLSEFVRPYAYIELCARTRTRCGAVRNGERCMCTRTRSRRECGRGGTPCW
jgi:creatine kinase